LAFRPELLELAQRNAQSGMSSTPWAAASTIGLTPPYGSKRKLRAQRLIRAGDVIVVAGHFRQQFLGEVEGAALPGLGSHGEQVSGGSGRAPEQVRALAVGFGQAGQDGADALAHGPGVVSRFWRAVKQSPIANRQVCSSLVSVLGTPSPAGGLVRLL